MKKIKLPENLFALVDDEDYERLNMYKWGLAKVKNSELRYAIRGVRDANGKRPVMHRVIIPCEGLEVDHVNSNGLDNRKCNLRAVTRGVNAKNRKSNRGSTSKFVGVSYKRSHEKWVAQIEVNGKGKHIGIYKTEEEAYAARLKYIVDNDLEGFKRE